MSNPLFKKIFEADPITMVFVAITGVSCLIVFLTQHFMTLTGTITANKIYLAGLVVDSISLLLFCYSTLRRFQKPEEGQATIPFVGIIIYLFSCCTSKVVIFDVASIPIPASKSLDLLILYIFHYCCQVLFPRLFTSFPTFLRRV